MTEKFNDEILKETILEDEPDEDDKISETSETKTADFSTLEVMARITENKIQCREIVDRWLLLTYDIPCNEEGNKARAQFYKDAIRLGAVQNTESVYLCPWTSEIEAMAFKLAETSGSKVIVWSAQTSEKQAEEITQRYDKGLQPILKLLEQRIDTLNWMIQQGYFKKARRYTIKTERILNNLEQAIVRRGSAQMLIMVSILRQRFSGAFAMV